jgi:CHAD domain-containing protein
MAASAMERFAKRQISALADALAADFRSATTRLDKKAIHQMRVSIRRFTQSIDVFEQYLPPGAVKKVRKPLRKVMRLSSAVRDLDIGLKYLKKHDHSSGDLADRRSRLHRELAETLHGDAFSDWRSNFQKEVA